MRLRVNRIDLVPGYSGGQLEKAVAKRLRCDVDMLCNLRTVRRSVDARGGTPRMVVAVEVDVAGKRPRGRRDVEVVSTKSKSAVKRSEFAPPGLRPLIVGGGPAGLLAAYELAEAGCRPLLVERGEAAEERAGSVGRFWKQGDLNPESNVLYGEGGAGLFSDGKLTSRSKDRRRVRRLLEVLVACGAPTDIMVDAEPHLGSDILLAIVPEMRRRVCELGGEVRFGAKLEKLLIEDGVLRGAVVNGEELRADLCVLATGHSARDTYSMLAESGVALESKPFAVGVRVELPQHRIDAARWGGPVPVLGHASFRMTRKPENGMQACYTFCMCPGGVVIACASEPGMLTTNGMSYSARELPFGNAAFLVPVGIDDFGGKGMLAGVEFQRRLEKAAFEAGGGGYGLPGQRLVEFLAGAGASALPEERSCERAVAAQLRGLLPGYIEATLLSAVPQMLAGMRGAVLDEMVVYASETRSSSAVRVLRGDDGVSLNVAGLYPAGEGAGYAGGIVSSGIDGLRAAESVLQRLT